MGIKKLNTFINNRDLIKIYYNLTNYVNYNKKQQNYKKTNITIVIDFWLHAYKFKYSYKNIIIGFWNQIAKLLSHQIIPIYVIDGIPPVEKNNLLKQRQNKKNNTQIKIDNIIDEIENTNDINISNKLNNIKHKLQKSVINISSYDLNSIISFFDLLKISYVFANSEADALCSKMVINGIATACLSDDMDMLVLGCPKTIKIIDGKVEEYDLNYIKTLLNITTQEQFVDLCILFGCDYLKLNFKLDNDNIHNLIVKYNSIENIIKSNDFPQLNETIYFIEKYNSVRMLFIKLMNDENLPHIDVFNNKYINPQVVIEFINNYCENDFDDIIKERIFNSIGYINFLHNKKT